MKKLLIAVCFMLGFAGMASAQTAQKKAPASTKLEKAKTASSETGTATGSKMKKDGTPDKRFKENKNSKQPDAGPTKKDGTPDMRFKKNKGKKG